jgi:hypothetical protein
MKSKCTKKRVAPRSSEYRKDHKRACIGCGGNKGMRGRFPPADGLCDDCRAERDAVVDRKGKAKSKGK